MNDDARDRLRSIISQVADGCTARDIDKYSAFKMSIDEAIEEMLPHFLAHEGRGESPTQAGKSYELASELYILGCRVAAGRGANGHP